jgi:hypothetical protein
MTHLCVFLEYQFYMNGVWWWFDMLGDYGFYEVASLVGC